MSSVLFSPINLGKLQLANRIVIPPMDQYSAENGQAGDWHLMHYGMLSHSGAGLLVLEATGVLPEGRISPGDLGLWSNETELALGRVLIAIKKYSTMPIAVQLGHAGRKASFAAPWAGGGMLPPDKGGWQTEAPSAEVFSKGKDCTVPQAMSTSDIVRVRTAFAEAAGRAGRIGLDAVEVHAAHGYLLHQFLSPLSNHRSDAYGGSPENRMRFVLEVFDAVRSAFPVERPVGVRISGTDWVAGGWKVEESCVLAEELQKRGCAYIHVSGGGLSPDQQLQTGPGYQVDMAAQVKQTLAGAASKSAADTAPMQVIAVGLITEAVQAESIVRSGQADLVSIGRGVLYEPRWPWHAAAALGAKVTAPPQYWRSAPYLRPDLFNR
jgi:2,4-dienoyl-CoA reductase-like NADH-dependent reductase (Old Yellow Enzyme family)